jgi:hypothetical protein
MEGTIQTQGVVGRLFASIATSFRLTVASFKLVTAYPKVFLLPLFTLLAVSTLVVVPLSILVWGLENHLQATGTFFEGLYFVTVSFARAGHWGLAIGSATIETYLLWSLWMIPVLTAVLYFATVGMHVATQQIKREPPSLRAGFAVANQSFGRIVALAAFSATVYAWIRYLVFQVLGAIPIAGRWIVGGLRFVLTAVTYLMLPIVVYERAGARSAFRSAWRNVKETWSGMVIGSGLIFFSLFALLEVFVWEVAADVVGGTASGIVSLIAAAVLYALGSTVGAALRASLYWYATTGEVPPGFEERNLPAIAARRSFTGADPAPAPLA